MCFRIVVLGKSGHFVMPLETITQKNGNNARSWAYNYALLTSDKTLDPTNQLKWTSTQQCQPLKRIAWLSWQFSKWYEMHNFSRLVISFHFARTKPGHLMLNGVLKIRLKLVVGSAFDGYVYVS